MNRLRACLLSSVLLSASSAQALGLLDAYQLAVRHDPTFQAALHERRAGSENRAIGRAGLLPSLRYDYNKARNDSTVSQGDARVERDYRSYASTLSLEQPLFDYEAYARYRQGEAQALFADEQFRGRSQELAVRLFAAYSETLFAREQVVLAEAQRRALETQLAFNQRAFEEGEGTRTDLLETRARLSLTRAEEIAAGDRAAAARRTLEAMLGKALENREAAPIERFPALRLQPTTFEGWRQVALQRSAERAPSAMRWRRQPTRWSAIVPATCPGSASTPAAARRTRLRKAPTSRNTTPTVSACVSACRCSRAGGCRRRPARPATSTPRPRPSGCPGGQCDQ